MTDRYENIRKALDAYDTASARGHRHKLELAHLDFREACDADTIRELLAERDALAAALEAAREDACVERCKRQHPHTRLTLTRDIAPDAGWHWSVTLPGGHLYDVSRGPMTFQQARSDLMNRGLAALDAADRAHRAAIAAANGGGNG